VKLRLLCCLLLVTLLCACVQPLAAQPHTESTAPRNKLFYIGLALYSESWSAYDVTDLGDELQKTADLDVVPLIASNFASRRDKYPVADAAAINRLARMVAERAGPGDLVLLHISTHGGRGVLASKIGNREPTALPGSTLARLLEPLATHRTVIIISACYSGSLIGNLSSPDRIIIAAARGDRSSFGCAAGNRHTFFGEAELHAFAQPNLSLHQAFTAIRADVAQMEQENDYTPSEPQVSVGANVQELYDAPLF
jgi:hypothetical protein